MFRLENFHNSLLGPERTEKAWNAMLSALAVLPRMLEAPEDRGAFFHRVAFGRLATSGKGNAIFDGHV